MDGDFYDLECSGKEDGHLGGYSYLVTCHRAGNVNQEVHHVILVLALLLLDEDVFLVDLGLVHSVPVKVASTLGEHSALEHIVLEDVPESGCEDFCFHGEFLVAWGIVSSSLR